MENIENPQLIQLELARCINRIGELSMEAMIGVDHQANLSEESSDLVFFNELASSLELMQSQVDYYFPSGATDFDIEEWAEGLAVLNSGADYFEDQAIELGARFGEGRLAECLEALSLCHIEAIPYLIAARLAHEEPEPAAPRGRGKGYRTGSSWAAQLLATS